MANAALIYVSAWTSTLLHPSHKVAQLSQRDRTAGWVNGQKWRQYFTDITGTSSTTVT